jgi:hypothetical protein
MTCPAPASNAGLSDTGDLVRGVPGAWARGARGRGEQARVGMGSVARANPGEGRQFNMYGCSAPCLFADSLPMDHERERQYF